jgi:hypothetical protein
MTLSTANIVALFALSAKAQQAPQGGAKLFANSLNGVNVDDFLSNYGEVDYSGNDNSDDYLEDQYANLNTALGDAPSYVYEDVGPSDDSLDYFEGSDYYDGTSPNQANAGRPNASEASAQKSVNSGINKTEGQAHNACRACSGETAEDCQNQPILDCNDSQDACQVEIRSQYEDNLDGSRALVHRYYSRCSVRTDCEAERSRNFIGSNKLNNKCLSTRVPRRLFSASKCTLCTKLGQDGAGNESTVLFGNNIAEIPTLADGTGTNIDTMLNDPDTEIVDFWAQNNWY